MTVSLVDVVVGFVVVVGRVIVVSVGVGVTVGMLGVAVHKGVGFAHEQKGHFVPVTVIPEGHPIKHCVAHESVDETQVTVSLVNVVVGFVVIVGSVMVVRVGVSVTVGILGVAVHRGVGFWHEQKGHFVPVFTIPDGHPISHVVAHETVEDTHVMVLVDVVVGFVIVVGRVMVVRVGVGITVGILGVAVHRGVGFWQEQNGHFVPVLTIPDGHPIAHIVLHETVEETQVTVLVDVVVGFVVSVGRVTVIVVGVGPGVAVQRGVGVSQVQKGQEVPVKC